MIMHARASGQTTSNFLTQASWRLYEIRQTLTSLCITSNFHTSMTTVTFQHMGKYLVTFNFWSDNLQLPYSKKATRQYAHSQRKQCGYPKMAANLFSRLERFFEESQVMASHLFSDNLQTGQTDLTFKLDFPGNLCTAALVIRAMFVCFDSFYE